MRILRLWCGAENNDGFFWGLAIRDEEAAAILKAIIIPLFLVSGLQLLMLLLQMVGSVSVKRKQTQTDQ